MSKSMTHVLGVAPVCGGLFAFGLLLRFGGGASSEARVVHHDHRPTAHCLKMALDAGCRSQPAGVRERAAEDPVEKEIRIVVAHGSQSVERTAWRRWQRTGGCQADPSVRSVIPQVRKRRFCVRTVTRCFVAVVGVPASSLPVISSAPDGERHGHPPGQKSQAEQETGRRAGHAAHGGEAKGSGRCTSEVSSGPGARFNSNSAGHQGYAAAVPGRDGQFDQRGRPRS